MLQRILAYALTFILSASLPMQASLAEQTSTPDFSLRRDRLATNAQAPKLDARPPVINVQSYVLVDYASGNILAQKKTDERLAPASLTKLMTLYIIFRALDSGQIQLTDKVLISKNAWKTGGSRMFLKEGTYVTVEDLIKGIIIVSGNDASVAMAEFMAGSEADFVKMMNNQAQQFNMLDTHFMDAKGMPNKHHYSTANDLAVLTLALVRDFPQYYPWYSEKSFTYNEIKQNNRNLLLWRYKYADGLKTGYTNDAGYCLAASAMKDNMRLISIVLGAPSDEVRTQSNIRLFNYGFRSFETHKLYNAGAIITKPKVWMGQDNTVPLGIKEGVILTIKRGQYKNLKAKIVVNTPIQAPIKRGESYGKLLIVLNDKVLLERPLIALKDVAPAGVWGRMTDKVALTFNGLWSSNNAG